MNTLEYGFCGDADFLTSLHLWKTPAVSCGDDRGDVCVDYSQWTAGLDRDRRAPRTTVASVDRGVGRRSCRTHSAPVLLPPIRTRPGSSLTPRAAQLAWMRRDLSRFRSRSCSCSAFWRLDVFTGQVVHDWSLVNFQTLWNGEVYLIDHVADRGYCPRGHCDRRRASRSPSPTTRRGSRRRGCATRC